MDHNSQYSDRFAVVPPMDQPPTRGAKFSLVSSRLRFAQPADPAPEDWSAALSHLLGWLGIDPEFVPAAPPRRLPRMADWAKPASSAAPSMPVFAPWLGWGPAAFQYGGLPGLPSAQFVTSYLIEHARGTAPAQRGFDIVLMSPLPGLCPLDDDCGVALPRAGLMQRMIRAAQAEGREQLAIICQARQRNAIARQLLAAGKAVNRQGPAIAILTIEDALPALLADSARWDAIIAMPDLRSTVFTLLREVSGVRKAWPMLWHGRGGLQLVGCETPGEGMSRIPLDAPVLIHALSLALHDAGAGRAAWRLHTAWAQLRDSGVSTPGRGGDAPYLTHVSDSEFVTLLCREGAASKRAQQPWRAIKNAQNAISGSHSPALRVVSSDVVISSL